MTTINDGTKALQEQTHTNLGDAIQGNDPIAAIIQNACTNPDFDVDKLEKMLEMQERREAKAAEREFAEAMADAQQEVPKLVADKYNKQTKSRYPSAASAFNAIKPIAAKYGLSIFTDEASPPKDGMLHVRVTIQHRGGHKQVYTRYGMIDNKGPKGEPNKTDVQGGQCTVTYLSRRLLCALFSVVVLEDVNEDLDGNISREIEYMTDDQVHRLEVLLDVAEDKSPGSKLRLMAWLEENAGVDNFSACPASYYDKLHKSLKSKVDDK